MNKEEILYLLDVIKVYVAQSKEFRNKFIELLQSIDEEIDKDEPKD